MTCDAQRTTWVRADARRMAVQRCARSTRSGIVPYAKPQIATGELLLARFGLLDAGKELLQACQARRQIHNDHARASCRCTAPTPIHAPP